MLWIMISIRQWPLYTNHTNIAFHLCTKIEISTVKSLKVISQHMYIFDPFSHMVSVKMTKFIIIFLIFWLEIGM